MQGNCMKKWLMFPLTAYVENHHGNAAATRRRVIFINTAMNRGESEPACRRQRF